MKKIVLLIVVTLFYVSNLTAQKGTSIDLSGKEKKMSIKNNNDLLYGFNLTQKEIVPFLYPKGKKYIDKILIEFYDKNNKIIHSYYDDQRSGPNTCVEYNANMDLPLKLPILDKNEFWPVIVAGLVAMCCVKVHVDFDGGGYFEWNCTCLDSKANSNYSQNENGREIPIKIKGKKYLVSKIRFIPIFNKKYKTLKTRNNFSFVVN